jgi:hypothetical protein
MKFCYQSPSQDISLLEVSLPGDFELETV